jgi:uncharacterized membrane protein YoaK (UPF0700 family)
MVPTSFADRHKSKMVVALLLTFASGLVDIAGYLGVFHFFTAHLTGTTVQLGHNLVVRKWVDVFAAGSIVLAFMGGSILGRVLIEIGSRRCFRKIASITLSIEAVLLLVVALSFGSGAVLGRSYVRLILLAGAMGIQTATLTGIGPLTVHTTFVTGMLNKIAQLISHIGFRGYDLMKRKAIGNARAEQRQEIHMTLFLAAIWIFYVGGAAAGTWVFAFWGLRTLFIAVAMLMVGLITDQIAPLSILEEKEQSER